MNAQLINAVYEGGSRNGVLTAVEDFMKEFRLKYDLHQFHVQFGLGLLTPHNFSFTQFIRYFG